MAKGPVIVSKAATWALKSGGRGARARQTIVIDELMGGGGEGGNIRCYARDAVPPRLQLSDLLTLTPLAVM
jgi:hypothetical protein